MNPNGMAISDPKNGGDLFKVPREVRDEIYRYLVKGKYIIEPTEVWSKDRDFYPHTAILASSRAISHEAAVVMFEESKFEIHLNFGEAPVSSGVKRPLRPYTSRVTEVCNRLMNLKCHIYHLDGSARRLSSPVYLEGMKDICATTIERFTGTDILRNRLKIIICCDVHIENTLTSPIFETLKRLRGFRTIRLRQDYFRPLFRKSDPQLLFQRMKKNLRVIEAHLEPALGPGDHSFSGIPRKCGPYRGRLTFHPNQHTIKTSGMEEEEEKVGRRKRSPSDLLGLLHK